MKKQISLFILAIVFLQLNTVFAQLKDSYSTKLEHLNEALEKQLDQREPGLAVIVAHKNQIIFEKYYGYANLEEGEFLNDQHIMGIASMSKQFEGMAALFLVEEGKLDLDEDVKFYLPELPIEESEISIRQLLSHTSGLPELTKNDEFMNHIDQKRSVAEIIEIGLKGEPTGEPGVKWQYCNTGYSIMVQVIEKLSGQSYASFVKEKIFDPLQMTSSFSCDINQDADDIAQRYNHDSNAYSPSRIMHFSNLIGGGGIISNAKDMCKWNMALLSGDNLPSNFQEVWHSNRLNNGEETAYGLGMGNNKYNGVPYYYHPGMGDGMNSVNFIIPKDDISITVIRNVSKPKLNSIAVAQLVMDYLYTND